MKKLTRAERIERAKRKVAMEIIVGAVAASVLLTILVVEINIIHNLLHI